MSNILIGIVSLGSVVAGIVSLVSWFAILFYGFKAVRRTRPGIALWGRDTLWNPANVLLRPTLLTEEGRAYRRKCFLAVGVFVASVGIPLLIAAATGNLK